MGNLLRLRGIGKVRGKTLSARHACKLATVIVLLFCTSCARYDKTTNTFYGWGKYKDAEEEFESTTPLSDIVNINLVKD